MGRIKGRDTQPELIVRSMIHRMGYRFRLHRKDLPGKPDIVLPRHNKVIFIHGCFWHGHKGCSRAARPSSNTDFWEKKLDGNSKRDKKKIRDLQRLGWQALILWQCELKNLKEVSARLRRFLS